jgi:hypothetical protein
MNKQLLELLISNTTTINITCTSPCTQAIVWCESFGRKWSVCYKNGDMSGSRKGEAVFINDQLNYGLEELRDILKEISAFKSLIETGAYCPYAKLSEFIGIFCIWLAKNENIDSYFK